MTHLYSFILESDLLITVAEGNVDFNLDYFLHYNNKKGMEKLRNDAYPIQSRGNVSRFIIATTKKVYLTCKTENHNLLITGGNELGGNCYISKVCMWVKQSS